MLKLLIFLSLFICFSGPVYASLAGPFMVWGVNAADLSARHVRFVKRHKIGGIMLYSPQYKDVKQYKKALALLSDYEGLVCIDQEGGDIQRIKSGVIQLPSAQDQRNYEPYLIYNNYKQLGKELRDIGITCNFAPVADLDSGDSNPIVSNRSYGLNPDEIAPYLKAAISGMQSSGLKTTVKHFPGHGTVAEDSHLTLPVSYATISELEAQSLKPFYTAIATGVDSVMIGHLLFPNIDARPASLSAFFVTRLLREEMGFKGLIFTDDLSMKALSKRYSYAESSFLALEAGVDMVVLVSSLTEIKQTLAKLEQSLQQIHPDLLAEKMDRIEKIKRTYDNN